MLVIVVGPGDVVMGSEQKPSLEMVAMAAAKVHLASREVAEKLAEILVKASYGEDELKRQLPFKIVDNGEKWSLIGNRKFGDVPGREGYLEYGAIRIEIAKKDCQILGFIRDGRITPKTDEGSRNVP
jgi:hypothetical protein